MIIRKPAIISNNSQSSFRSANRTFNIQVQYSKKTPVLEKN